MLRSRAATSAPGKLRISQARSRTACAGLLAAFALVAVAAPISLPGQHIDADSVTVSGISSGGYMAVQMHVAHSALVKGVGVIAAGPYGCAQTASGLYANQLRAQGPCMQGAYSLWQRTLCLSGWAWASCPGANRVDVASSVQATQRRAASGEIDPVAGLRSHRVMLISGSSDATLVPAVVDALRQYYLEFVAPANVHHEKLSGADHTFPTDSYRDGNPCSVASSPYISDCRFDAAKAILNHLYPGLRPRNDGALTGALIEFDQTAFISATQASGMAPSGWIYVPESCAAVRCRLHVAFHGCKQSTSSPIKRKFVEHAGYNRWADSNALIVLYPQAFASSSLPLNPNGCWDWWGYTDTSNWDTQRGAQIQAVKAMIDRLGMAR